jgi:hypothetical protein
MGRPLSTVPGRACLALAYPPAVRDLRWAVAGLVVGSTLLTGCSEKVEANETLPSTSASPTTESLPPIGPADFPVPDEARTKDAPGAEAFLRYWIDLMNHQRAIPAGQPFRDLGPNCQECQRIARVYDDAASAGRHFEGGELGIESIGTPVLDGGEAAVSFFANQDDVTLVDSAGSVVESLSAASHLGSGIRLVWSDDQNSWIVNGFTLG